ncbi:MAG: hypothetical protein IH989_01655 [Planctomycetes bacterium]|nr:hypothetical protein [Planctomycetota bacterium]
MATESAAEAFAELSQIESDAFTIEEEALNLLDRAAGSAKSAAGYTRQWVSEARRKVQTLSPEARSRSAFDQRGKADWVDAFVAAQEADARLAKAWIHYARYRSASQNAATLTKVSQGLQLVDADAQAEADKAQHAHDVGIAEITQAMTVLKRSHGGAGKHWTLTAQAAGTTYLLALFGHEDYVADAIETYRSAVRGRENESFAATFVARLSKLENR